MSSYPTDDSVQPTTPIFDETVSTTAVNVSPEGDAGSGSKTDQAKQAAGQAAGTVKDTAGQAAGTVKETAGQAKEQAKQVGSTAVGAGQRVASTTRDQASRVASDAFAQARQLFSEATGQLSSQASAQQSRAASGLRTIGQDLSNMGTQHQGGGVASELVQNLSQRANQVAEWLENREPAEVLDEVRQYAARRPGVFIALAAVTGAVAARLTKALVADAKPDVQSDVLDNGHLGSTGTGSTFPGGTTQGVDYGTGYVPGAYVGDDPFVEPPTTGYEPTTGYGTTGGVR
jgi:hypothetical protein